MSDAAALDAPVAAQTALYVYGLLNNAASTGPMLAETIPGDPILADPILADPILAETIPGEALLAAALGVGVGAVPVHLLPAGPLTALVSPIAPGPVAQTRRNMIAHTAVLERMIARTDVLPVRFGTVAAATAVLTGCIAANAAALQAGFRDIEGRVELGLKASWRDGVVFAEIIAADPELCRLRDRLRSRPASETYYERVELGRRVEAALVGRRAMETAAILAELAPLAERVVELRTLDEDMILNRAFLVRRAQEARFDAQVQAVAERCSARVSFRYVGPVPPYNFIRLQVGWLTGAGLI